MENRFGIKDFILLCTMLVVIVLIVLGMIQYDRQWDLMRQTNTMLTQQTTDLARIRQLLEQGVNINSSPNNNSSSTQPSEAAVSPNAGFERVLAAHAKPDYAQGDDLVDTFMSVPQKLTPLVSGDLPSYILQSYVQDTLCGRDPNTMEWIPSLATSWKISPDQLTIDFTLRRGVTFSDGSPLAADDVVFTFTLAEDPKIEDPRIKSGLDKVKSVTKIDDDHVRFVFKEPYFLSFELAAATPIMPKAFYSKYSPEEFNRSTGLLMGSGPYRLDSPTDWRPVPGKPVVLVRNERYWGPAPSFNRCVWDIIENPAASNTAFRNGDTDMIDMITGGLTSEQFDQMCADKALVDRTQHYVTDDPTEGFIYVGWNQKQGRDGKPTPFADPRVRRAMTMLTDRDSIVKNIMRGYATPITGPFCPLTPQADKSIKPYPYDPQAALKLLAEAGYTTQGDRLVGPDGKPLEFKLMFNSSNEIRKHIASFLRDSYAKAGILVTPEPVEWSVMLKRLDERQFDVYLGGWSGTIEFDAYQIFSTSQIDGTGDNFIQFSDPALDKVIEQARATVDESKRMPLWHQADRILHVDEPYTFLYLDKGMTFVAGRIHGLDVTKLGLNGTNEWYVPRDLQKYHN